MPPLSKYGSLILECAAEHDIAFHPDSRIVEVMGNLTIRGTSPEARVSFNPLTEFGEGSNKQILVHGDVTVESGSLVLSGSPEWYDKGSGKVELNNPATTSLSLHVMGDVTLKQGGSMVVTKYDRLGSELYAFGKPDIRIELAGSLINESSIGTASGLAPGIAGTAGALTFYQRHDELSGPGGSMLAKGSLGSYLRFYGANSAVLTSLPGAIPPPVYQFEVDKGTSQDSKLTIDHNGGIVPALQEEWLMLKSGTLELKFGRPDFVISRERPFLLPLSTALVLDGEGLEAYIGKDGKSLGSILLGGRLAVLRGRLEVGNLASAENPDIEFAAGNGPTIEVGSSEFPDLGKLFVYGSIRRNVNTLSGHLDFTLRNGEVQVHGHSAARHSNAAFEQEGGCFDMLGGEFRLYASGGDSPFGDLFIKAGTAKAEGGTLWLMNPSFVVTRRIASNADFFNVSLEDGERNINELFDEQLRIRNDFTLGEKTRLNAKRLDVFIGGDITSWVGSLYDGSGNVTTLNGRASVQSLSGDGELKFHRLVVESQKGAQLDRADTEVMEDLLLLRRQGGGHLSCGINRIKVHGDLQNDAGFSTEGPGKMIMDGGTSHVNQLFGTGTYGSMTIAGTFGAQANDRVDMRGTLHLEGGNLAIGSNELAIGLNGDLKRNPGSDFFVKTHGGISDLGIKKELKAELKSFEFLLGVGEHFTPAVWTDNSSTGAAGWISVSNVDNHVFSSDPTVTANSLKFHWRVNSPGVGAPGGTLKFQVPSFYKGVSMDVPNSHPARYENEKSYWVKQAIGQVSELDEVVTIEWQLHDSAHLRGFYTAGCSTCFDPLGAVESIGSGLWQDAVWREYGKAGSPALSFAPDGPNDRMVYINPNDTLVIGEGLHVEIPALVFVKPAKPTDVPGKLIVRSGSWYVALGEVSGHGEIEIEDLMPVGGYTNFFNCSGGEGKLTLAGSADYTMPFPVSIREIPILWTTGSGLRKTPNHDLTICKELSIRDYTVLDNSEHNKGLRIQGTIERQESAGFKATVPHGGWVELVGSRPQKIEGFDENNRFNELIINNPFGVDIPPGGEVTAAVLRLTNGVVRTKTPAGLGTLTIHSYESNFDRDGVPTGLEGSEKSFVHGPMTLRVMEGGGVDFRFPLGSKEIGRADVLGNQFFLYDMLKGGHMQVEFFFS